MARALACLIWLCPLAASAWPIAPQTIWELTQDAELVVLARVAEVKDERRGQDTAFLEVEETWKGAPRAEVAVAFNSGLICPAPPKFVAGERVVAFLHTHEGAWRVVGLSYGTRYPHPDDLAPLRTVVREAVARQARGEGEAGRRAWAVLAAGARPTRWDGLFVLLPQADPVRAPYTPDSPPVKLSPAELAGLARAFAAAPPQDDSLVPFLVALQGHADRAVDEAAVAAIDAVLARGWPVVAARAMPLVLARFGIDEPAFKEPEDEVSRIMGPWVSREELLEVWLTHRPRLPSDRRLPVEPPRKVRGVGDDTPM